MSAYQSKKGGNHANDESLYANIIIFPIFAFVTMRTFNHKRKIILLSGADKAGH